MHDLLILHIEKSEELQHLSLESNRNPLLALRIQKRAIIYKLGQHTMFADVALDCKAHLFRWSNIPGMEGNDYEKVEARNFLHQCKVSEKQLMSLIHLLKLPMS